MSGLFFGGRREDRARQPASGLQSVGELDSTDLSVDLVILPAGAGQVSACDTLDWNDPAFLYDHAAASQLFGSPQLLGKPIKVCLDQMILDIGKAPEPEVRHLSKDFPLVRNPRREDDIECRDAVRRHQQQPLSKVVEISDLAASNERRCYFHARGL